MYAFLVRRVPVLHFPALLFVPPFSSLYAFSAHWSFLVRYYQIFHFQCPVINPTILRWHCGPRLLRDVTTTTTTTTTLLCGHPTCYFGPMSKSNDLIFRLYSFCIMSEQLQFPLYDTVSLPGIDFVLDALSCTVPFSFVIFWDHSIRMIFLWHILLTLVLRFYFYAHVLRFE